MTYRDKPFFSEDETTGKERRIVSEQIGDMIRASWGFRHMCLSVGSFPETEFICPNCLERKPFAGDNVLHFFNSVRGTVLVCNDCLLEYEFEYTYGDEGSCFV